MKGKFEGTAGQAGNQGKGQTELTILVHQNPASEAKPNTGGTTLGRWITDLGNDLMWIGLLDGCPGARCLPNRNRPSDEIRGWTELSDVLELVPSLLAVLCPVKEGTVIVRTEVALYVAVCHEGLPEMVLGIEPAIPIARLGFD